MISPIYIITIAGAESAIGLGILVAFYRLYSSLISTSEFSGRNTTYIHCHASKKNINKLSYKILAISYTSKTKQAPEKFYSISPLFITGLFDAEGSLVVSFSKNSRYKTGWSIQSIIQIKMHVIDTNLIQSIQDFFGGIGYVSNSTSTSVEFRVSSIKSLVDIIFPHFDKYP